MPEGAATESAVLIAGPTSAPASTVAPPLAAGQINRGFSFANLIPWTIRRTFRRVVRALERWKLKRRLALNFRYDESRYVRFSSCLKKGTDATRLAALITMDYHRLEKGLSLGSPRPDFGTEVALRLADAIKRYTALAGWDSTSIVAANVLAAHHRFRTERQTPLPQMEQILAEFHAAREGALEEPRGGTITISRDEIHRAARRDLAEFFNARHSVRHFDRREVDVASIRRAVEMAQRSPSVCNRQSARVYLFVDRELKLAALACQNGNRGFTEEIDKLLVVTSDLGSFVSPGERNQCWIDGGLFAMSLVYALHSLGLGTCCLNWSVEHEADRKLRQAAGIRESEAVIMMIAVGHLPEVLNVPQSPRKLVDDVLTIR